MADPLCFAGLDARRVIAVGAPELRARKKACLWNLLTER